MKKYIFFIFILFFDIINGQNIDTNKISRKQQPSTNIDSLVENAEPVTASSVTVEPILISANRWEQNLDEISISLLPVQVSDIDYKNPQTAADLLSSNSWIFMQKSQLGGGSPMIRGFAANRVLIVFDRLKLNNAIFRSGNLQNVISIDANALEQVEVIFGPGSVIYGSDAIGGVMDFHTKEPDFSNDDNLNFKLSSLLRYSSANNEKTGNINFNFGLKKLAFFTNFSYSDFDNLKMGSKKHQEYTRNEYVTQINGVDSIVKNENPNIQKFSAYSAYNFLQKISYKPNINLRINYSFYYSSTSNVPRYDRLIQYSDDKLKYAQWFYGPQKYLIHNFNIENNKKTFFYDELKLTAGFQDYTESRHDRKYRKEQIRERIENVKIGSINLNFFKKFNKKISLFYGIEGAYNYVSSKAFKKNINTAEKVPYASRYPDGSTYQNYDIYTQFKVKFTPKLTFNAGARYSHFFVHASFDTSFYNFPFSEANLSPGAVTGSSGLVYSTNNHWNFAFNIASGFRAPNIDDVGKVFDSEPGSVVVPNPNLKPEYIYNAEININRIVFPFSFYFSAFYSYLDNAMVRRNFSFNGQDSIIYDGQMSKVQALVNENYAIIYGVQTNLKLNIFKFFGFNAGYNYIHGTDSEGAAIRHVAPPFGNAGIFFNNFRIKSEIFTKFNNKISYDNLAPSEKGKPHLYATNNEGNPYSPAWWTLNFRFQYKINRNFNFNFAVENILDYRYRPYSSGIVAPGRNFIFSLKFKI